MQRALSFDASPPLRAPMRFFLTAPVFGIAGGLLLTWQGADAFASRWMPSTLALTHLLVLGFLAMTMIGALLQMLPVVAGVTVPRVAGVGCWVWIGTTAGTVLLASAFLMSAPLLFQLATVTLALAFAGLLAAVVRGLLQAAPQAAAATVNGMRLALLSLAATLVLGVTLGSYFGWNANVPVARLVNFHAAWGLLGWVGILIVGVGFQVIPMFQATPVYPRHMTRWLPGVIACLLLLRMLPGAGAQVAAWCLAAAFGLFGVWTLRLLARRRRPKRDVTTLFWRLAMGCLAVAALMAVLPGIDDARPMLLGVLFIAGCAVSAVSGMLYKIVPFLLWYHLQEAAGAASKAPSIRILLSEQAAEQHFWLHAGALAMLVGAVFVPELARPAGAAFAIASLRLALNLASAALRYRRALQVSGSAVVGA
ncbi:permease [Oxalobacteraceae bacterium OM1]|nr:permease [Oxalobacteraceae bacterium OM1]